jgi:hypothetical protein
MNTSGSNDTASARNPSHGVFFRLNVISSHIDLSLSSNHNVSQHLIQSHRFMWELMVLMWERYDEKGR